MCNYCKPLIKQGVLPAHCVLNGLQTVPVPPELAKLDRLSKQLIQRAKCYQTVVWLGTYTAKVCTHIQTPSKHVRELCSSSAIQQNPRESR